MLATHKNRIKIKSNTDNTLNKIPLYSESISCLDFNI